MTVPPTAPTSGPAEPPATPDPTAPSPTTRRPYVASRFRLLPLLALVLCVLATGLTGALGHRRISHNLVTTAASPFTLTRANVAAAAQRADACTPAYDDGRKKGVEPWQGKAAKASEKVFDKKIKKSNGVDVKGKHGWVFYSDLFNENFSQALGRVTQTRKEERTWATYLSNTVKAVRNGGGQFYIVVSPANWDVYHQNLPGWAQPLRGTTSLENLMADHPELPWIDTRSALAKAAKKHNTYEPVNGHWTPYGGWVAWKAITKCLRASNPAYAALREPAISGVGVAPNLNEFTAQGVPDGKPQHTYPIYAQPHPATTLTRISDGTVIPPSADGSIDETVGPAMASTPGGMSPLKLLMLRDSTGNALSANWDWTFQTSYSYEHGIGQEDAGPPDYPALMASLHPNVVILDLTERVLSENPNE